MSAIGNKGKFTERLKRIIFFRRNKKKVMNDDVVIADSKKIYADFLKVMAAVPKMVHENLKGDDNKSNDNLMPSDLSNNEMRTSRVISSEIIAEKNHRIQVEKIRNIDVEQIKLQQELNFKRKPIRDVLFKTSDIKEVASFGFGKEKNDSKESKVETRRIFTIMSRRILPENEKTDFEGREVEQEKTFVEKPIEKVQLKTDNVEKNVSLNTENKKLDFKEHEIKSERSKNDDSTPMIWQKGQADEKRVLDAKKAEKEILNIIKKRLIKTVNELEILQSELYILSEVNGESAQLKECREELDKIKNILCKVDKLKEEYDFLKDNYDFEYLLELDDNTLVDKIIELRDAFGNNELKAVSADYKLLDAYKYLYLKLDNLQEKTVKFEDYKKDEIAKLEARDINFEKLKNDVYSVDNVSRNYEYFVKSQNDLLKEIDENVAKISSYEQVRYYLKGFNRLFLNSVKYFGLLMVTPLKGIIPSIATETLITGNLIKNLYRDLKWEEERKTVYEAIDYSSMINNAISDLNSTASIVDATLEEIVQLKIKYNEQFKKYQGDISEYRDVMHKIGDMENKILGNKIKIELMRERALEEERENNKKMKLVRKLNS